MCVVQTGSLNMSDVEVLYLSKVTMEDAGEYTCLAGNSIGYAHQSAWLTVISGKDESKDRMIRTTSLFKCLSSSRFSLLSNTRLSLPIEEEAADAMESMETKYTDIIIYACGFLALIMATIIVVLCRMQVQPRREPFDALPVQKLSKFPLRRQVQRNGCFHKWHTTTQDSSITEAKTKLCVCPLQYSVESNSSGKSSASLMRVARLSSSCSPMLAGVMEFELPYDPDWEFPREK